MAGDHNRKPCRVYRTLCSGVQRWWPGGGLSGGASSPSDLHRAVPCLSAGAACRRQPSREAWFPVVEQPDQFRTTLGAAIGRVGVVLPDLGHVSMGLGSGTHDMGAVFTFVHGDSYY